jgi:hypothetical protein
MEIDNFVRHIERYPLMGNEGDLADHPMATILTNMDTMRLPKTIGMHNPLRRHLGTVGRLSLLVEALPFMYRRLL